MRVRRRTTSALGEIESATALLHLEGALRDKAPEVRRIAAWALGEIEDPAAIDVLAGQSESTDSAGVVALALKDSDAGVRPMAAWALGEIEAVGAARSDTAAHRPRGRSADRGGLGAGSHRKRISARRTGGGEGRLVASGPTSSAVGDRTD